MSRTDSARASISTRTLQMLANRRAKRLTPSSDLRRGIHRAAPVTVDGAPGDRTAVELI